MAAAFEHFDGPNGSVLAHDLLVTLPRGQFKHSHAVVVTAHEIVAIDETKTVYAVHVILADANQLRCLQIP